MATRTQTMSGTRTQCNHPPAPTSSVLGGTPRRNRSTLSHSSLRHPTPTRHLSAALTSMFAQADQDDKRGEDIDRRYEEDASQRYKRDLRWTAASKRHLCYTVGRKAELESQLALDTQLGYLSDQSQALFEDEIASVNEQLSRALKDFVKATSSKNISHCEARRYRQYTKYGHPKSEQHFIGSVGSMTGDAQAEVRHLLTEQNLSALDQANANHRQRQSEPSWAPPSPGPLSHASSGSRATSLNRSNAVRRKVDSDATRPSDAASSISRPSRTSSPGSSYPSVHPHGGNRVQALGITMYPGVDVAPSEYVCSTPLTAGSREEFGHSLSDHEITETPGGWDYYGAEPPTPVGMTSVSNERSGADNFDISLSGRDIHSRPGGFTEDPLPEVTSATSQASMSNAPEDEDLDHSRAGHDMRQMTPGGFYPDPTASESEIGTSLILWREGADNLDNSWDGHEMRRTAGGFDYYDDLNPTPPSAGGADSKQDSSADLESSMAGHEMRRTPGGFEYYNYTDPYALPETPGGWKDDDEGTNAASATSTGAGAGSVFSSLSSGLGNTVGGWLSGGSRRII